MYIALEYVLGMESLLAPPIILQSLVMNIVADRFRDSKAQLK